MDKETKKKIFDFIGWAVPVIILVFAVYSFTTDHGWGGAIGMSLACGILGFMIHGYFQG